MTFPLLREKIQPEVLLEQPSEELDPHQGIQLKKLGEKHKQVLSLIAQGEDRQTISAITGYTPEYVTWLTKQDVCQEFLRDMISIAETSLKAQFCKSVEVLGDTLKNGSEEGKLKAVKLNFEATGRIGKLQATPNNPGQPDRLTVLAERLVTLLHQTREKEVQGEVLSVETEGAQSGSNSTEIQRSQPGSSQPQQRAIRTNRAGTGSPT